MPATTTASTGLWRVWRVAGGRRAEGLCPPENHTRPSTVTRGCGTRELGGRRELHGLPAMEIESGTELVRLLNHGQPHRLRRGN
jgi:hypothetical protein